MKNKAEALFWFGLSILFVLGVRLGYWLSEFPRLEPYRLLNVIGLSYDLMGVLVLSELFASSETWKRVCVNFVAPAILWLHTVTPFGAIFGSYLGQMMHKPSFEIAGKFAVGFFSYSMLPVVLLNEVVVFPFLKRMRTNVELRFRWFGLLLVVTGTGVQLLSAIMALKQ